MSKGIDEFDNSWYEIDDQFDTIATNNSFKTKWTPISLKTANVNKQANVTFMGDSVLDCKAYTGTGKGTVDYVIKQAHGNYKENKKKVNDISIDGFTIPDFIDVVNDVYGNAVVISAGGNDLLAKLSLLKASTDNNITMGIMNAELDKLSNAYETLLYQLNKGGRKFLLITCYEGNLAYNPQRFNNVDNIALSIVSMWNDRLYRIANVHNNRNNSLGQQFDVLDTRTFMTPECFYNEIEPNEIGAKRIATQINKWLYKNEVI
jgi:hypothetical protein